MKLQGFIGPAYTLDSVNVDAQRCVNLYPEIIESGTGKGAQVAYLRATHGLEKILTIGDGPIRCIHEDSIGRLFVVSGDEIFRVTKRVDWLFAIRAHGTFTVQEANQSTDINTTTDVISILNNGFTTGQKVQVESDGILPTGLTADTDYWVISVDDDSFKLASSLTNAAAGTQIDITAAGSGTMTVTPTRPTDLEDVSVDDDVDYDTNSIGVTAHGLHEGLRVRLTGAVPLPGGLAVSTDYYVIRTDADNFQLATSIANVLAGTEINLTEVTGAWGAKNAGLDQDIPSAFTMTTSTGRVKAASMSFQGDGTDSSTFFVDGDKNVLYLDDASGDFLGQLSSFGYTTANNAEDIVWSDGYFILNDAGTNKFWVSDLASFNVGALSFASSEGDPDILLALMVSNRNLYLFNEKSTEVFANTGNADFPFERVQGGFIEIGCAAKYSVAKVDGTILWLGRSKEGQGSVYAMRGMTPERVSTHAIEQAIAGYADISTATAYAYQSKGHKFYVLNFDEATWVYDLSTGLWHERAYNNDGTLERHRADVHAFSTKYGAHLVGDYESAEVYLFKDDVYSDDGDEITRLRSCPHLSSPDLNWIFYHKFQLDMETGIGLDGAVQGSSPTVMLDWSDDGGHTWSSESFALADAGSGSIGEYKTRVIWRRLGKSRDRIFRVKMTDPVKCVFIDANIDIEMGAS